MKKPRKCKPKKMAVGGLAKLGRGGSSVGRKFYADGGAVEEVKKSKGKKFSGWGKLLTKYAEKPKKTKEQYEELTRQNAKNKVKHV